MVPVVELEDAPTCFLALLSMAMFEEGWEDFVSFKKPLKTLSCFKFLTFGTDIYLSHTCVHIEQMDTSDILGTSDILVIPDTLLEIRHIILCDYDTRPYINMH